MNPRPLPPGLLASGLLLWGWSMDLLPVAILMAIIVEAARWLPWRVAMTTTDYSRVSDLTSVILAAVSIVLFVKYLHQGLFAAVTWMPAVGFLLLCSQLYSEGQSIPLAALIYRLRRQRAPQDLRWPEFVDVRPAYFFTTLVAASIALPRVNWFYPVASVLLLVLLWRYRARGYTPALWLVAVALSVATAYAGEIGLNRFSIYLQDYATQWFMQDWRQRNLTQAATFIGRIGRLKTSNRIIMRIEAPNRQSLLLRQAVFNHYQESFWHGSGNTAEVRQPDMGTTIWRLQAAPAVAGNRLTVHTFLSDDVDVLALPAGSYEIDASPDLAIYDNAYGNVTVAGPAGPFSYSVRYGGDVVRDAPPGVLDMWLSAEQRAMVQPRVDELGLQGQPPARVVQLLQGDFQNNFRYTLQQRAPAVVDDALRYFLYQGKAGHCEYFATTGVMLLRAAGLPARYVTGYAMTEYDADNGFFIVRNSHAHAWISVYFAGRWHEVDFTPSQWVAAEEASRGWLTGVYDVFANAWFGIHRWWAQRAENWTYYLAGAAVLLLLGYVLRDWRRQAWRAVWRRVSDPRPPPPAMAASPFDDIVSELQRSGAPRYQGETLRQWLQRLQRSGSIETGELLSLLEMHYRYRFAAPATKNEAALRQGVAAWYARQADDKRRVRS